MEDIFEEQWKIYLAKLKEMMTKFGIKSKEKFYDQNIIRSMFFVKPALGPNGQNFWIDDIYYEMTNGSKNGFWNSKLLQIEVMRQAMEINDSNSSITPETLAASKKAFIAELKKLDKDYIKHKKNVHPELNGFIQTALKPLINVMDSNFEMLKIEELMKKQDIPDFRFNALEEKFCITMEALLKILTSHGPLKEEYKMQRMLNIFKYKDWEASTPMAHYLQPLKQSIYDL
jgi:hypothetical protein